MKVIYADKLIDALGVRDCHKHESQEAYDTLMKYEILQAIEDQPTAYDVDKVVGEIEVFGGCAECRERGTDKRFYYGMGCKACVYGKIVDIVKRGGADDNTRRRR